MHLRNRLDTETVGRIAQRNSLAVQQADTDAEQILVDISQIGDIIGILTVRIILILFVSLLCYLFQL